MAFRVFTVPIHDDNGAIEELNGFLGSHKVLSVVRRWVDLGASSFWSFCVDYLEHSAVEGKKKTGTFRGKVDYRETLSPEDFAVFAKLRDWRTATAQQEAIPVYTIFTNEQLAQMVKAKAKTKSALEQIAGVGDARVGKYGAKVLEVLQEEWPADEKNGLSV